MRIDIQADCRNRFQARVNGEPSEVFYDETLERYICDISLKKGNSLTVRARHLCDTRLWPLEIFAVFSSPFLHPFHRGPETEGLFSSTLTTKSDKIEKMELIVSRDRIRLDSIDGDTRDAVTIQTVCESPHSRRWVLTNAVGKSLPLFLITVFNLIAGLILCVKDPFNRIVGIGWALSSLLTGYWGIRLCRRVKRAAQKARDQLDSHSSCSIRNNSSGL